MATYRVKTALEKYPLWTRIGGQAGTIPGGTIITADVTIYLNERGITCHIIVTPSGYLNKCIEVGNVELPPPPTGGDHIEPHDFYAVVGGVRHKFHHPGVEITEIPE